MLEGGLGRGDERGRSWKEAWGMVTLVERGSMIFLCLMRLNK
jgi:hypothetical protein